MSRQVPEDRALSDSDRAYLTQLGTRQALIERLDADFPPRGEEEQGASGEPPAPQYDTWSKDELLGELERRKISKSGSKAEVIARLEADDAK